MKREMKSKPQKSQDMSSSEKRFQLPDSSPTPDQIRWRAYQIYLARGGGGGRELDDWLQAECELQADKDSFTFI